MKQILFMRKKYFVSVVLLLVGFFVFGQQSHINFDDNQEFRKSRFLYLTETYLAAQEGFETVLEQERTPAETQEASEFYAALTGLVNDQRGAEKRFFKFQEKYPRSVYMQSGAWQLGNYYLKKGEFDKAYKYLSMGDLANLPKEKRNRYQFKLGYAAFMTGKEREALRLLEPMTTVGDYQEEASYYVGHIYYAQKDFDQAFTYFDELRTQNPDYAERVLPYVVQIEFNNKEYQKAITDGKELLSMNSSDFIQSEVSKIVGESYFSLKKYNEAIPYLEAYQGKKTNADYYQLGYAYYQKAHFEKAISLFNKIIGEKNALAQTAYYQLGNAYLQTDKKQEALAAFGAASKMEFNPTITQDAAYNYAKLSYDIGNPYQSTPQVIQGFLNKYPGSRYKNELNDYLISSYISSGNYKRALQALGEISNKNWAQKKAEQQAAFLYGIDLFQENKMAEAIPYFSKAAQSKINKKIQSRATFWLGESNFRLGKYAQAERNFEWVKSSNQNIAEKKELNYQLGYTYYKLEKFDQAVSSFQTYLNTNPSGAFKADAQMRLADSYIGTQNIDKALQIYKQIAGQNIGQSSEAAYNRAIVLGIQGKNQQKIDELTAFLSNYPDSQYRSIAQLELADAYLKLEKNTESEKVLNQLIKSGKPEMVARARMKKGMIYYNQSQNKQALSEFKTIAEEYPQNAIAVQAVDNAKRIYIEEGKINEFERWAKRLDFYQIDQNELEQLAFDNAQKKFDDKNYTAAVPALEDFVGRYPQSAYKATATYFLGESFYQLNEYSNATTPLSYAASQNNQYQEDALLRLSQVYLKENQNTQALLSLEQLNRTTDNAAYLSFTQINLMRLYSDLGKHHQAVGMANQVLANNKNEQSIKEEAHLIKARNLWASGNKIEAKTAYTQLEKAASNAVKAEALYFKAYFLNQEKNYTASNEVIFGLASQYAEQQYWGSKALVIMADNYYYLDDLYQANYTLDTVIENFSEFPEVIAEAKELKNKIKG